MAEPIIRVHGSDARAQRKLLVRRDTGEVVNVIMYDPAVPWQCPDGCELVDPPAGEPVGPGWIRQEDGSYEPQPAPTPAPDPQGFLSAAIGYLGTETANALLTKYPLFYPSVLHVGTGETALGILDTALSAEDLTQQQYDDLQALWDEHFMPRPAE